MPLEREKNPHASGFSSVWEIFIVRPQVFLSSFFSSQRFSPLTLHSAADSQLWFFSRTGFFLALHTLCFIVFWKSSFVVRCSTAAYFSSFFLGSGLSSATGHTTFHIHIGPSTNSIIICILYTNRKGGFRSCNHITPVVNLEKVNGNGKWIIFLLLTRGHCFFLK